ncbi:MAG: membrane protein insertase YidC [Micrococcales bacterium]|nr:MAG: membrane protein insertase YidC [Micrococcales bacterium]PIE27022.1 MAG: membrane protein insertase YidC [Micrococcales bacterium]
MVQIHDVLDAIGMAGTSGWTWALSIVGLTVFIRVLIIPLFVRQINASRGMQLIQPEMRKIQQKYKGKTDQASREAMSREMMALYRENGTNPFSSCLPILAQMPIFFALFRVLNNLDEVAAGTHAEIGLITQDVARQIEASELFGASMSSTFMGSEGLAVKILCLVMIVLMSGATFYSQRMLMTKNMPAAAMESNPFMQQQKIMLYVFPVIFAVSGVSFPIGVLIYWVASNLWAAGQQFYVIHRMPAPGSQAERELNERRARRGKPPITHGKKKATTAATVEADPEPVSGQRQQPKRKNRQKATPGSASGHQQARSAGAGQPGAGKDGGPAKVAGSVPGAVTPDAQSPNGRAVDGSATSAKGGTPVTGGQQEQPRRGKKKNRGRTTRPRSAHEDRAS